MSWSSFLGRESSLPSVIDRAIINRENGGSNKLWLSFAKDAERIMYGAMILIICLFDKRTKPERREDSLTRRDVIKNGVNIGTSL